MMSEENKNLITIYSVTVGVAAILIIIIVNFNNWFFPNSQDSLTSFTPATRGSISEKDLRFSVLTDQKFVNLKPILNSSQLVDNVVTGTITGSVTPSVKPTFELRRGDPFNPF